MPVTLYYYPLSPPVRAVQLVAKAVGVKLDLIHVDLLKGEHKKPEFIEINPQHVVPTLVDGDLVLWESRAILGYLVDKYAKNDALYPKDTKKRAVVNQRLYFDCGTLYQRAHDYYGPVVMGGQQPDPVKLAAVEEALGFLNTFLEGQQWVACNQRTIADFTIAVTISNIEVLGISLAKYTNIVSWFANFQNTFDDYDELNGQPAQKLGDFFKKLIAKKA